MSTRETVAPRETQLLRPAVSIRAQSWPLYARILAWAPLHKMAYLASDLAALTLTHILAVRLVEKFFHVPTNAVEPNRVPPLLHAIFCCDFVPVRRVQKSRITSARTGARKEL